ARCSDPNHGAVASLSLYYLLSVRVWASKDARFEVFVKLCSHWKAAGVSMSSVHRQRQLPSARPGRFIRASLPRLRRSCNGVIANAATDDHAKLINTEATSRASPAGRFR